jgi:hypothetical protein
MDYIITVTMQSNRSHYCRQHNLYIYIYTNIIYFIKLMESNNIQKKIQTELKIKKNN